MKKRVAWWCALLLAVASVELVATTPLLGQQTPPRTTLQGHTGVVMCVAFSPDGKTIASGHYEGRVYLWEARSAP